MKGKIWKQAKALFYAFVAIFAICVCTNTAYAGNSFATATQVGMGQRVVVNFEQDGEKYYYKFTTDATPGYYSVNFGKSSGDTKYLNIYAGDNQSYSKVLDTYLRSNGNNTHTLSLLANHTYYVECSSYSQGGQSNFTISKINDDYANVLAQGTRLNLGSTVEGSIEVSGLGECDTFIFTTTGNNSFYEMDLSCTGNNNVKAYVYEGADESYNYYDLTAYSGNTETNIQRLEKNKTYYVKIRGRWDDATHYKFSVKEIRDDAGDDFSDAVKLTNKKTKSATIQVNADCDFFKFKTDKKKTAYQFYFKNKSVNSMEVTIYSNNDIASALSEVKNYYISSASSKTFWLNLKKNHTYYVKVEGSGNCSYNVLFKDCRSAIKNAKPSTFKAKGYSGWFSRYAYLSWKNNDAYSGYEIYRSTSASSGFKRIKKIKGTSYYYDRTVKKGRTYYYKMRYYVRDNGKYYYSKWTKVKKVKIK